MINAKNVQSALPAVITIIEVGNASAAELCLEEDIVEVRSNIVSSLRYNLCHDFFSHVAFIGWSR